jgi:Domain of unknown function (DUF4331)
LPHHGKRFRKTAVAVTAIAALGLGIFTSLGPTAGFASSHREAPLVSLDPSVDSTDLYAFVSPDKPDTVTLISNWIPFESPSGGPNFYKFEDGVHYDINIDNNGDAKPDIVYRWTFTSHYRNPKTFLYNLGPVTKLTDANLNFFQSYDLDVITSSGTKSLLKDAIVAPSNVGVASMPDYKSLRDQAIVSIEGGKGQSFVGQVDDPFFLDLRVFDLLYGTNLKEAGNDSLAGFNVHTMALQVPKADLARGGDATKDPIIGIWTTAERQTISPTGKGSGQYVQVDRLGNPLVNEVVVPVGAKDLFNESKPQDDGQFLSGVTDPELPKLIEAVYKIKAPKTPRNDLVSVFLTGVDGLNKPPNVLPSEELRLNMSIPPTASPNRMGVIGGDKAGFPNGRRLQDDVIDIALQVVEGALVGSPNQLGDGVNANDVPFESAFPYMALPHSGSDVKALGTTASKQSPAPTTAPAPAATAAPAKGVSSGTATGIGVGAAIGGLLIGGGIAMAMFRRRRRMA